MSTAQYSPCLTQQSKNHQGDTSNYGAGGGGGGGENIVEQHIGKDI